MILYFVLTIFSSFIAAIYTVATNIYEDLSFHELSILPWHIATHKNKKLNILGIVVYSALSLFSFPYLWVIEFFIWFFADACTKDKE